MHRGGTSDKDLERVEAIVDGGEKEGVLSLVDGLVSDNRREATNVILRTIYLNTTPPP